MKPWARWMINHNLKFLVLIIAYSLFPLYIFYYISDAWHDFNTDISVVKKAISVNKKAKSE